MRQARTGKSVKLRQINNDQYSVTAIIYMDDAPTYLKNSTCSKQPPALHFANGVDRLAPFPSCAYERTSFKLKLTPQLTAIQP